MSKSPFCPVSQVSEKTFTEKEFIHYMEVESVSSDYDPSKPSEFLIEKSMQEYERVPIDEYINSFASKVGLKNELKGIVSKQQMDDYIATHKATAGFTDLTKLPDSELEMAKAAAKLDSIWDTIPGELKGSLTKEEFLKTLSVEKIKNYVLSQLPKQEEEKGE